MHVKKTIIEDKPSLARKEDKELLFNVSNDSCIIINKLSFDSVTINKDSTEMTLWY